ADGGASVSRVHVTPSGQSIEAGSAAISSSSRASAARLAGAKGLVTYTVAPAASAAPIASRPVSASTTRASVTGCGAARTMGRMVAESSTTRMLVTPTPCKNRGRARVLNYTEVTEAAPAIVGLGVKSFSYTAGGASAAALRIEQVAQAVAHEVEPEHGEVDRQPRKGRVPPPRRQIVAPVADHCAPLRVRRLGAEADEPEAGGGQDRTAHVHAGLHD